MKFDKKYISGKFPFIVVLAIVACVSILYHMLKTMTTDRDYWLELRESLYKTEHEECLPAQRGNILSTNGELMASTLPNYKVNFDFLAGVPKDSKDQKLHAAHDTAFVKRQETLSKYLPPIAGGLARICPAPDADNKPTRDSLYYYEYLKYGWENAEQWEKARCAVIQTGDSSHLEAYNRWKSQRRKELKKRFAEMKKDSSNVKIASARSFDLLNGYVLNYIQFSQLEELPLLCHKNPNVSGLAPEPRNNRKRPFGRLASKVLGGVYGVSNVAEDTTGGKKATSANPQQPANKDSVVAIYGLELAYDSLLRGKSGVELQRRLRSHTVSQVKQEPEDGYDIVSTIDVSLQDICEGILRKQLQDKNAQFGLAILMEVQTGDVKALVNLTRDSLDHNQYKEELDYTMGAAMEPGSTFKTASIMVALDDGEITVNDMVDVGVGSVNWYGRRMSDSGSGAPGMLDVTHVMMRSSNVGVSKLIDSHYHKQPEKFVEGLRRVGIGTSLDLNMRGYRKPVILGPKENPRWADTSIPWMSIGYGVMVAPIQTVTFYNAIANNGKMVRPRFARATARDGKIVEEFPVEVIKEQICKPETVKQIQEILKKVVNGDGQPGSSCTGKNARNKYYSVSGKTGTAQVVVGGHYERSLHYTTFCGYFPSDAPKYTCIVSIQGHGLYGGSACAPVVAQIAERIYSKVITRDVEEVRDSLATMTPMVMNGNTQATQQVLGWMKIPYSGGSSTYASATVSGHDIQFRNLAEESGKMPNLKDMGARDAIYAIESRGMKARVKGYGRVKSQSLAAGSKVTKGKVVELELSM